jgi:arylsulfatase A-like enzyme
LYLAFTAPHDPLIATPEDLSACSHIPHYIRRNFCGMVYGVDRNIGYILKSLENNNLMENTIIAFSSDNGGAPWSGGFNYPFRGAKMSALEGGSRVPAFIYGPKFLKTSSGSTYKKLFHIADWYPTLLSFANQKVNPENR